MEINQCYSSLLREIFEAIAEDPTLLDPLVSELDAPLPIIDNSIAVDNSSECLGCIVSCCIRL